jgi:hypothetical protein
VMQRHEQVFPLPLHRANQCGGIIQEDSMRGWWGGRGRYCKKMAGECTSRFRASFLKAQ